MARLISLLSFAAVLGSAAGALQAQVPDLGGGGIGMGHLHVLVEEADYEAHRKAWIEGLGARPEQVGPLEALLLPGVVVAIKKGESAGGSEGSAVNHLGFMVRDLEATVSRWEKLGYEVFERRPGPTQAFLRFPGNIKVELSEFPMLVNPVEHHHIHLYTTDVAGMQKWYLDTFGGKAGKRGRFEEVWFPGVRLSFAPVEEKPAGTKGRGVDHIGFEIDGLEAFCKRAASRGIEFDVPYRHVSAIKTSVAFLTDPWGTYIELTEGLDKIR